jgi:glycosyltransferase involved in cell wall biosynthesis
MISDIEKKWSRVAFISDQMTSFGGADREMFSMLKLFPNADIYTIVFNRDSYGEIPNKVYCSFVQKFPKPKSFYRHLKILSPIAYESFNLKKYDLVISISAGPARGVITGIDQPHIAMVMTPPRSLWDNELNVRASKLKRIYGPVSMFLNTFMRMWDYSISKRVDYWTANSEYIAKKIRKRYGVESTVLYPGISQECFERITHTRKEEIKRKYEIEEDFILVVSRLYDYKNIDWAIRACIKAKKNLVIIGEGPDRKYLEKIAKGNPRIKFLGFIPDDSEVRTFYSLADVLLFCGIEDFGLVPVEAMAQGTPVLAYREGGVLETVKEGVCGEFFNNEKELTLLLKKFDNNRYNPEQIINIAEKFTEKKFLNNLEKYLTNIYDQERKKRV